MAVLVIVVGCTYGIYFAATQSTTRYRARTEVERDARALLRMMGREVRCSYFPSPSDLTASGPSPANTTGLPAPPAPLATDENTPGPMTTTRKDRPVRDYLSGQGRGGSFLQTLTTGGIADPDQPSSGLYNVAYRLDPNQKMIFRRQVDLLEAPDSKAQESSWQCVARGVESVKCSFFDGKQWQDGWTTDQSTGLPYAVKIELALKDTEGRVSQYATTITVPLAAGPLAQSQSAAPAPKAN